MTAVEIVKENNMQSLNCVGFVDAFLNQARARIGARVDGDHFRRTVHPLLVAFVRDVMGDGPGSGETLASIRLQHLPGLWAAVDATP